MWTAISFAQDFRPRPRLTDVLVGVEVLRHRLDGVGLVVLELAGRALARNVRQAIRPHETHVGNDSDSVLLAVARGARGRESVRRQGAARKAVGVRHAVVVLGLGLEAAQDRMVRPGERGLEGALARADLAVEVERVVAVDDDSLGVIERGVGVP